MTSLLLNKTPASYLMILEENIIVLKVFRKVSKSHSKYWEIVTQKCVFWSLEADKQLQDATSSCSEISVGFIFLDGVTVDPVFFAKTFCTHWNLTVEHRMETLLLPIHVHHPWHYTIFYMSLLFSSLEKCKRVGVWDLNFSFDNLWDSLFALNSSFIYPGISLFFLSPYASFIL